MSEQTVMGVRDRLRLRAAASRPEPASPPIPWVIALDPVDVAPTPKRPVPPKPTRDPGPKPTAKPSPQEHMCETCPTMIAGGKRFCEACKAAKRTAHNRRRRERRSETAGRVCGVCQQPFTVTHGLRLYCSDRCRLTAKFAKKRMARQSKRAGT